MPYQRKTEDKYQIEGFYNNSWKKITAKQTQKAAMHAKQDLQRAEPNTAFHIIKKRSPININTESQAK